MYELHVGIKRVFDMIDLRLTIFNSNYHNVKPDFLVTIHLFQISLRSFNQMRLFFLIHQNSGFKRLLFPSEFDLHNNYKTLFFSY